MKMYYISQKIVKIDHISQTVCQNIQNVLPNFIQNQQIPSKIVKIEYCLYT